jgi:TRAP-type mannitol/chloroaromatic compound transport system substrate-binding protein
MLLPACGEEEATPAPTATATLAPGQTATATPAPGQTATPTPSPTVQQAAKVYKWNMQGLPSPGTWSFEHGIQDLCNKIALLTDNQVQAAPYGPGGIVPFDETRDAVSTGTLHAALWWTCYDLGVRPVTALFGTAPFGFNSNQEYQDWFEHWGGQELFNECYNEWGIVVPASVSTGSAQIAGQTKKEYKSYQEMGGAIFRSSGLAAEVLQSVGLETIFLPAAELFTAIERGVIDVVEYAGPNWNYRSAYHEVAPFVLGPGWHEPASASGLLVNEQVWNDLPEHLQQKIIAAAKWHALELGGLNRHEDIWAFGEMQKYGCTFNRLPDRDLQILYDAWLELAATKSAEDPLFKKVFDSQQNYKELLAEITAFNWDLSFERSAQPLPKIITD